MKYRLGGAIKLVKHFCSAVSWILDLVWDLKNIANQKEKFKNTFSIRCPPSVLKLVAQIPIAMTDKNAFHSQQEAQKVNLKHFIRLLSIQNFDYYRGYLQEKVLHRRKTCKIEVVRNTHYSVFLNFILEWILPKCL